MRISNMLRDALNWSLMVFMRTQRDAVGFVQTQQQFGRRFTLATRQLQRGMVRIKALQSGSRLYICLAYRSRSVTPPASA